MWSHQFVTDSCSSQRSSSPTDSFHVLHKVPFGDTPYVKAKHVQLVEKDPDRAIAMFWAAINAGDRVDSALKDMAIVMKQQNRPEEAIEAIISLRHRCTDQTQEALDNVLLDLYKRCGRLEDQISLLKRKLHLIHQGLAFNGKRTKTARSQGKKFQVSIEQEASRLLGNLGWAYMQQANFVAAEAVYSKALSIEPDSNKVCNLGICLMKQGRLQEARVTLESIKCPETVSWNSSNSQYKSYERALETLGELSALQCVQKSVKTEDTRSWNPLSSPARTSLLQNGILAATSGFGPLKQAAFGEFAVDDQSSEELDGVRSRRKRSQYEDHQQSYWTSSSNSNSLNSSTNTTNSASHSGRVPLTCDWTNKASYDQSGKSMDLMRTTKSRRNESILEAWREVLEENIPSAKRCIDNDVWTSECCTMMRGNNNVNNQLKWDDREDESVRDDEFRFQRRLKVFEDMTTLPAF